MKTNILLKEATEAIIEETAEYTKITTYVDGLKVSSIFPKDCPDGEKNLDKFVRELNRVIRLGCK